MLRAEIEVIASRALRRDRAQQVATARRPRRPTASCYPAPPGRCRPEAVPGETTERGRSVSASDHFDPTCESEDQSKECDWGIVSGRDEML